MGYKIDEIEKVEAVKISGFKTDVQVQIKIYLKEALASENLSIKLVSNPQGFNQIDKRWVKAYAEMWNMPEDITRLLKLFTGEISPTGTKGKDSRRTLLTEMNETDQKKILEFFTNNKILIVSDILKGREKFPANWMLVALILKDESRWVLKPMNKAMSIFAEGTVRITDKGSLKIGNITVQRKGGDNGRETAKMLQFKINPVMLFDIVEK